jgi:hypothetical protein
MAADQKVISIGPYALIRHPMYSGVRRLKFKSAVGRDYTANGIKLVELGKSDTAVEFTHP